MDTCKWSGFNLEELWQEFSNAKSLPKFKQAVRPTTKNLNEYVKQYTRLTINLETMLYFNNFKNLNVNANPKVPIINSYDLFAIRPACVKNDRAVDPEKIFENVCRNSECDIISIDFGQKFSFFLDKTTIKMALNRGANFEITYSKGMLEQPLNTRKVFINNAMNLVKLSKGGNGIIFASETSRKIFMRSPIDVF